MVLGVGQGLPPRQPPQTENQQAPPEEAGPSTAQRDGGAGEKPEADPQPSAPEAGISAWPSGPGMEGAAGPKASESSDAAGTAPGASGPAASVVAEGLHSSESEYESWRRGALCLQDKEIG